MYGNLSLFYDILSYDVNYKMLADFVDRTVRRSPAWKDYERRGEKPILLDAGTGTGSFIRLMTDKYECIGLDISEEMLDIARSGPGAEKVLWICQDMCRMDLFGSVTAIVSLTDSVDHIITEKKLLGFFKRAHNFLDPGGLLIFDVFTEAHFSSDTGIMENFVDLENESCFWSGRYDKKSRICTYNISCFTRTGAEADLYRRYDDVIREKIWSEEILNSFLRQAGFSTIRCIQGGRYGAPGGKTGRDRLYYICEKEY